MAENVYYATGRRKSAIAKVWLFHGEKGRSINGRDSRKYLGREELQSAVDQPLKVTKLDDRFRVRASVVGGGTAGQAGAVQLGVARALIKFDETLRASLRKSRLLTRDPREKERKKPGRKGARRSFQFTKR